MAAKYNDIADGLIALSLDDNINTDNVLTLDNSVRIKLTEIKRDYESIFSWNIYEQVGNSQSLLSKLIDKIQEKCVETTEEENQFYIHKFCYKLITSFEFYNDKKYEESLLEIKKAINSITLCTTDDSNKQYSNAFNHIALSTYAYIALSMNLDSEKIMENIKPMKNLNQVEKSAIWAAKAYVFKEYAPIGNNIALDFADQARKFNPSEPEWIVIWLIVKGRVRRYNSNCSFPDNSEMKAANTLLCEQNLKSEFLVQASNTYLAMAFAHSKNRTHNEYAKYIKLASNLLERAISLEKDGNMKQLGYILMIYIRLPEYYRSSSLIDEVVQKLQNFNYYYVNFTLGKYYIKCKKDYQNAQIYLSRAMIAGTFQCTIELFKLQCLIQPEAQFQFVKTLNMIYDNFLNPKRRFIILIQIIIYYYHENNPKEVMHYLKLLMDQDIDKAWKKEQFYCVNPFERHGFAKQGFNYRAFIAYVTDITNNYEWNLEEKTMVVETFNRFNKTFDTEMDAINNRVDIKLNQCEKQDRSTMYEKNYYRPGNRQQNKFQYTSRVYNNLQNDGNSKELSWRHQKD